jgi:deoxyribonuclease-4
MMKKDTLLLGSHVDMNKKNGFLVGAFKQAQNEKANTFMFFAGPPQSTMRTDINEVKIEEFAQLCQENNIDRDDLLVHAPYLINLANPVKTGHGQFFDWISQKGNHSCFSNGR